MALTTLFQHFHPDVGLNIQTLIFVFVTYFAARHLFWPHYAQLASIPAAHWSVPYSRTWILWQRFQGRENAALEKAHGTLFIPLVRVAPNELSVANVEGLRNVYGAGFEKHGWYGAFENYG